MERIEVDFAEVRQLLKKAKKNARSDFAKQFVADQEARIEKYGEDTWFSEKQMAVLKKIASESEKPKEKIEETEDF